MITIHKALWIKKFTEIVQSAKITKIISQGSVFFNLTAWTHTVKETNHVCTPRQPMGFLTAQHRVHFVGKYDLTGKG
jgi:hypothetical protein